MSPHPKSGDYYMDDSVGFWPRCNMGGMEDGRSRLERMRS